MNRTYFCVFSLHEYCKDWGGVNWLEEACECACHKENDDDDSHS